MIHIQYTIYNIATIRRSTCASINYMGDFAESVLGAVSPKFLART